MTTYSEQVIYNASHNLDALCSSGVHSQKTLSIKITRKDPYLQVQVHECNDYLFNYTVNIDRTLFDQMKLEQSLDISFAELPGQLLDLLQHTANKDMLIRLEYGDQFCKLFFYEKIKIKSLIFLTIELRPTNQREIIKEMSHHIKQLKDSNKNLLFQVNTVKTEIVQCDELLQSSVAANKRMETKFIKELAMLEKTLSTLAIKLEHKVTDKLLILSQKYFILIRNIETVKVEHKVKTDANSRLLHAIKKMRIDHVKDCEAIDALTGQLNVLKDVKNNTERNNHEYKTLVETLQHENVEINTKMGELHKDLKEATFIIAQKTKTHEEMAKDLVQANSMLVNFTNHYDNLSKEMNTIKKSLSLKEREIYELSQQYNELKTNFDGYKKEFNYDDLERMKQQVFETNKHCEELEKKARETNKLNGLLTRKLAAEDNNCVDNITSPNSNVNIKNPTPWQPRCNF